MKIKLAVMPGTIRMVNVAEDEDGQAEISEVLDAAGIDTRPSTDTKFGYEIRVGGEEVSEKYRVDAGQTVLLVKRIKGN
jgi:hypothetical protein